MLSQRLINGSFCKLKTPQTELLSPIPNCEGAGCFPWHMTNSSQAWGWYVERLPADRIMAISDFNCCPSSSARAFLANAVFVGYFLHRLRSGCQLIAAASVWVVWLQILDSSTLLARVQRAKWCLCLLARTAPMSASTTAVRAQITKFISSILQSRVGCRGCELPTISWAAISFRTA